MPSNKDPNSTVQSGPGLLPPNTVSAGALIAPVGDAAAALDAHLIDDTAAHAASAISATAGFNVWRDGSTNAGDDVQERLENLVADLQNDLGSARVGQAAVSGETWAVVSGSIADAQQVVVNAINARSTWVLDANPANTAADYAGANALIDAANAAFISASHPVVYLRPGTYNWDDSYVLSNVVIIGANRDSVIIENTSTGLRVGNQVSISNVTVSLTDGVNGNLTFQGLRSSFMGIFISNANNIEFTVGGRENVWSNVTSFGGQTVLVDGTKNTLDDLKGNFSLEVSASYNIVTKYSCTSTQAEPALTVTNAAHVIVDGVEIGNTGIPSGSLLYVNGAENVNIRNVYIHNYPDGIFNHLVNVDNGENISLENFSFEAFAGTRPPLVRADGVKNFSMSSVWISGVDVGDVLQPMFEMFADTASVSNVHISNVGTSTGTIFQIDGHNTSISNVEISAATINSQVALLLGFNNSVSDVYLTSCDFSGSGRLASMQGIGSTLRRVYVSSSSNMGTSSFITFVGSENAVVEDLKLVNSGGTTALDDDIFDFTAGVSYGTALRNIFVDNVSATGAVLALSTNSARGLDVSNFRSENNNTVGQFVITGTTENPDRLFVFSNIRLEPHASATGSSFDVVSGARVVLQDSYIEASTAGDVAVDISDSREVSVDNCYIYAVGGQAALATNSTARFSNCEFVGGSTGTGNLLFNGWGHNGNTYGVGTLYIEDCRMRYGTSNVDATNDLGHAVIEIGEYDAVNGQGALHVDGLLIYPDSTVTAQNSNPIVSISGRDVAANGFTHSTVRNLTVDLKAIAWTTSGLNRGLLTTGLGDDSSVLELSYITASDINVINCKNSDIADARFVVFVDNVNLERLKIEGPTVTEPGTGNPTSPVLWADGPSQLSAVEIGRNQLLSWAVGEAMVELNDDYSTLTRAYMRTALANGVVAAERFVNLNGAYSKVSHSHFQAQSEMSGTPILMGDSYAVFEHNHLEVIVAAGSPIILGSDVNPTVRGNLITGSMGAADNAIVLAAPGVVARDNRIVIAECQRVFFFANQAEIVGNHVETSDATSVYHAEFSGNSSICTNNYFYNSAGSYIIINGDVSTIALNHLIGTAGATVVRIVNNGTDNIVNMNQVTNLDGATNGTIIGGGSTGNVLT